MSACALGSAGKPSAVIAGGRNGDEKLLQELCSRLCPKPVALAAPERVERERRAPCKALGLGGTLGFAASVLCREPLQLDKKCQPALGALPAPPAGAASPGLAAPASPLCISTSSRGRAQPGAGSSSRGGAGNKSGAGAAGAAFLLGQSQLPRIGAAGAFPSPERSRQTDGRPRPAVPRVPAAFGGRQDGARVAAAHLLQERLAWWLCYPSWPAGRYRGVPLS